MMKLAIFGLFCLQAVIAAPPSLALVEESAAPPWLTASENPTHLTFNQDWTLEKGTSYANNSYDTVGMFGPKKENLQCSSPMKTCPNVATCCLDKAAGCSL